MAPLAVRVDAGGPIGAGHLMRCLALAHAWGDRATIAMATPDSRAWIAGAQVVGVAASPGSAEDATVTASAALAVGAQWVAVDGYHFGVGYHRALRAVGLHTLCIDDNGEAGEYVAEAVLNQNLHAAADLYERRAPHTVLLLGPEYVLMRPEFADAPAPARTTAAAASRVLVTLGGGTAAGPLVSILNGLAGAGLADLQVTVLTGPLQGEVVTNAAARVPGRVELVERTDRMRDLMATADLAISAGGSTTWELAFMGVPAALTVAAPNQSAAAAAAVRHGIAVPLGRLDQLRAEDVSTQVGRLARDPVQRARMSAAGQALIDGRGAARTVAAMRARAGAAAGAGHVVQKDG